MISGQKIQDLLKQMSIQWKCHHKVKSLSGSAQTTGPDVLQGAIARQGIPWRKHLPIAKKEL